MFLPQVLYIYMYINSIYSHIKDTSEICRKKCAWYLHFCGCNEVEHSVSFPLREKNLMLIFHNNNLILLRIVSNVADLVWIINRLKFRITSKSASRKIFVPSNLSEFSVIIF